MTGRWDFVTAWAGSLVPVSTQASSRQGRPCWWGISHRAKATRSAHATPNLERSCKERARQSHLLDQWSIKNSSAFETVPTQRKCQACSSSACFSPALKLFAWRRWGELVTEQNTWHIFTTVWVNGARSLGQSLPLPQSCTTPGTQNKARYK